MRERAESAIEAKTVSRLLGTWKATLFVESRRKVQVLPVMREALVLASMHVSIKE